MRFGRRHLGAAKWEPEPGSEAAAEIANTEVRQAGDPWGEDPPRTAYAAANLLMTGVLDNLASIHTLIGIEMPVIGPTVVARSAIEIASGTWWLMQPGIGARRRVCRELALSLESARRARQVAEEFQAHALAVQVGQEITDALQQEARVLQRIMDLGIAPPSAGFSPKVENEKAESATDATAACSRKSCRKSGPGTSIYRTYSAVTHGTFYGLMNFMEPGVAADGSTLLSWHLPSEVLDSTVQMAIAAFGQTYKRINKVMGWGKSSTTYGRSSSGRLHRVAAPSPACPGRATTPERLAMPVTHVSRPEAGLRAMHVRGSHWAAQNARV